MKKRLTSLILAALILFSIETLVSAAAVPSSKVVIKPKYDEAYTFSEGLSAVKSGTKWGAVNKKDQTVIKFTYDSLGSFKNSLAVAGLKGKFGVIDTKGRVVIKLIYDEVTQLPQNKKDPLTFAVKKGDVYGLANKTGKIILAPQLKISDIYQCDDGMIPIIKNSRVGFVNYLGKELIKPQFEFATGFNEGVAFIRQKGLWGLIDKTGKILVKPTYEYMGYDGQSTSEGLIPVCKKDLWGFINTKGVLVIPLKYGNPTSPSDGSYFHNSFCNVYTYDKEKDKVSYGFINKAGKEIIPIEYDKSNYCFSDGLAGLLLDKEWHYFDQDGEEVFRIECEDAREFSDGLALITKDGKKGYIDKKGRTVIEPVYDSGTSFSNGTAAVSKDGKYGIIDETGKEITSFKYDRISEIMGKNEQVLSGIAIVQENKKLGLLSTLTGKEILPIKYDDISYMAFEGMIGVQQNGKWGYATVS